jgi:hypothetical protein
MMKSIFLLTDMKDLKALAIIQDFVAHCAMQNKQMAKGRHFKSKSELEGKILW